MSAPAADVPAVGAPELEDPVGVRRRAARRRLVPPAPPWVRRLAGPALLFAAWCVLTGFDLVSDRSLASPGAVVGAARRAIVFQEPRLLPWTRALGNVTLGLRGAGRAASRPRRPGRGRPRRA